MKYNVWMQDALLRQQTASERLTLEQEYLMQQDWMKDDNKATFIIISKDIYKQDDKNEIDAMVGDINLFFTDPNNKSLAELEVMIAEPHSRGKGYGHEAAILMMSYGFTELGVQVFQAKIGSQNIPSLKLFEKIGFTRVSSSDVFKEITLELKSTNNIKCIKWTEYKLLTKEIC